MIAAYSPARSLFRPSMSACLSKAMLCPPLCAAALLPNEPTGHRVACATPRGWYVLRSRDLVRFHWVQPNGLHLRVIVNPWGIGWKHLLAGAGRVGARLPDNPAVTIERVEGKDVIFHDKCRNSFRIICHSVR